MNPAIVCHFCGESVDPDAVATYRYVTGWEQKREQGGTNHVALRQPRQAWAHEACVDRERHKVNALQQTLV